MDVLKGMGNGGDGDWRLPIGDGKSPLRMRIPCKANDYSPLHWNVHGDALPLIYNKW